MEKCKNENVENVSTYEGFPSRSELQKSLEKRSKEFDQYMKFDKFLQRLLGISFVVLFILYLYFMDIRPFLIEQIPVKRGEVLLNIFVSLFVALLTSALIVLPLNKIYENKERIRVFWVIFFIVIAVFVIKTPWDNISKNKFITHEDYLDAIEIIEVKNEGELAERVEEYNVISNVGSDSNIKVYNAKFYGKNYTVDVTYNDDFSIEKSKFSFYDSILPALVIFIIVIVLDLPTLLFLGYCKIANFSFPKKTIKKL